MKYIFVIFVAFLIAKNSLQKKSKWVCQRRTDGSCRYRNNNTEDMLARSNRNWTLTNHTECEDAKNLNDIVLCKSTCANATSCDENTTVCVANQGNNCKLVDQCTFFTDYCQKNKTDTYADQLLRCANANITSKKQTGKCAPKNPKA